MTFETTATVLASTSADLASAEPSSPSFHELRDAWRICARAKLGTAAQHAAYTLLRKHSIDAAFTPITNPSKIVSNSNDPMIQRRLALNAIVYGHVHAFAPWAQWLKDTPVSGGRYTQGPDWMKEIQAAAKAAL